MICTWKGCDAPPVEELKGKTGRVWAHLCKRHAKEFHDALADPNYDPKRIVRIWALAGSKHPIRKELAVDTAKTCGKIVDYFKRSKR